MTQKANEVLQILKDYIDERVLTLVETDPEWQSKKESERLWEEFIAAFSGLDITPEQGRL